MCLAIASCTVDAEPIPYLFVKWLLRHPYNHLVQEASLIQMGTDAIRIHLHLGHVCTAHSWLPLTQGISGSYVTW